MADHHGHYDLVESLKAARDEKHQHRRSKQHSERVAKDIQSNKEAGGNHDDVTKIKKSGHHTVHIIRSRTLFST